MTHAHRFNKTTSDRTRTFHLNKLGRVARPAGFAHFGSRAMPPSRIHSRELPFVSEIIVSLLANLTKEWIVES